MILHFKKTRTCPKCGHKEIVQESTDHGSILVHGENYLKCKETAWVIADEVRLNLPA